MSNKTVKIDDMSTAINDLLKQYGDKATDAIRESAMVIGKQSAKELKRESPKHTGKYSKGWKYSYKKTALGAEAIVYNETDYQLTHLLENGHMNRDGSRTEAVPHIAPVNEKAQADFVSEIEKRLK